MGGSGLTYGTHHVHAETGGLRPIDIERLREMGDVGQLVVGLVAGYSPVEIAMKRDWTLDHLRDVIVDAMHAGENDQLPGKHVLVSQHTMLSRAIHLASMRENRLRVKRDMLRVKRGEKE